MVGVLMVNLYCIKDSTLLVPHEDNIYVCLECEVKIRVEDPPQNVRVKCKWKPSEALKEKIG